MDVNGITLEVAIAGDAGNPAVLLLHGWPDTHALWRHQIPALEAAGYRVIAPDLRGFGASTKPRETAAYGLFEHVGDVVGILDELGVAQAHVIGHDWGAALGWLLATVAGPRVTSLSVLSVGHPIAFRNAGLAQRAKSWYMLLFQFEGIAEQWLSADDFANFTAWSRHPDIGEAVTRLSDPDALRASLEIYRANVPPESLLGPPLELPPVVCPTLGVWSTGDMALTERQMTDSAGHVAGTWRYEQIVDVGHWIPLEAPDVLNRLILEHLRDSTS